MASQKLSEKLPIQLTGPVKFPKIEVVNESHFKALRYGFWLEEKYDGSQLSFWLNEQSELEFFNKGKRLLTRNSEIPKMWKPATAQLAIIKDQFKSKYTYHGELIAKLKDKTVIYGRLPKYCFILYDINDSEGNPLNYDEKVAESNRLGFDYCQKIAEFSASEVSHYSDEEFFQLFNQHLQTLSSLSDNKHCTKIEGFVIKQLHFHDNDQLKIKRLKWVSPIHQEKHGMGEIQYYKSKSFEEVIRDLGFCYSTPARLQKAKNHLMERSDDENPTFTNAEIIEELDNDFRTECLDEYNQKLKEIFGKKFKDYYDEKMILESARQYQ
jgi:hypothetical protein